MSAEIAGEGLGGLSTRVTSTNLAVLEYLIQAERDTYGRDARREGISNTFWCGQAAVKGVKELLGMPL